MLKNTGIRFLHLFSLNVYLILSMIIINFPHGNLWIFRIKSVLNQCSLVTSIFERWGKFWDENEAQPLARAWLQVAYYHTTLCPCPAISLLSDPGSFQRHWKHQSSNKGWKHPQHVIASIAWVDIMSKQALASNPFLCNVDFLQKLLRKNCNLQAVCMHLASSSKN